MKDFKPINTPFLSGVKIKETHSSPLVNNTLYRQIIGCILYLTHTRCDISYVVSVDSRNMDNPHKIHYRVAKRILNFLQGTRTCGIHYVAISDLELVGFTDYDCEGNTDRK